MTSTSADLAAAARVPAEPSGTPPAGSLAGLIGVLDRADGVLPHHRAQPRRSAASRADAYRSDAYRRGTVRRAPLRSVPQAPAARPAPVGTLPAPAPHRHLAAPPPPAAAADHLGRMRALTRRVALWGAGNDGEYLAWRAAAPRPPAAIAVPRAVPTSAARIPEPRRPSRLRALTRRLALWGAGSTGEYLAWRPVARCAAPPTDPRPEADRPVVLRELPSTPTIKPAASSPAAALLPGGPALSAGPRGARPGPSGAVPVPGIRPGGRPERSVATGWPSPRPSPRPQPGSARLVPAATGLVRTRGDPLTCPVRGSPTPAREAQSPGSFRNPFPPGPAPRTDPGVLRA